MKQIIFAALCVFFFWLFGMLGVWQLHRYHYKQHLLANYQSRLVAQAIPFKESLKLDDLTFQPIKATGAYLPKATILIQNQFYQGVLGFHVITPFKMADDNKLLLVDRGWVGAQESLPILESRIHWKNIQKITGHIKLLDEYQFILGKNILQPGHLPITMQKVDVDELTKLTGQAFYPFILRLDPSQPNGYIREWTITTVMPQRHLGYAVQWFAMAIVLFIAYLSFYLKSRSCKRKD